jgi:23S rRNA C2498 (ribose-2'-O)-methylase RlmM
MASTLDDLNVQTEPILARQNLTLAKYFLAPLADINDEQHWKKSDTAGLMGAAHLLFRHALLDRIVFSMSDNDAPFQLSPRSEFPDAPSRLKEV